eukprot:SAG31_NODE_580_length_13940_cov_16.175349_10_plen_2543_part_00
MSVLISLTFEHVSGHSDHTEASELFKQRTIDSIKSHFCEIKQVSETYYARYIDDTSSYVGEFDAQENITYAPNAPINGSQVSSDQVVSGGADFLCSCRTVECVEAWVRANFESFAKYIVGLLIFQIVLAILGWSVLTPWTKRVASQGKLQGVKFAQTMKWNEVLAVLRADGDEAQTSVVVRNAVIVTETWYFESAVALSVVLLMYVLAKQSYAEPPNVDEAFTLRIIEIYVTVFVSLEMWLQLTIKLGSHITSVRAYVKYFKDPWNIVDIFVIVVSWLYLLAPYSRWISIGRVLRVMRPVRSLRLVSGVQLVLQCIYDDAQLLKDVTTFLAIGLILFALVGVTLFRGALQFVCVANATEFDETELFQCPDTLNISMCNFVDLDASTCARREELQPVGNDAYGVVGFDNLLQGFVTMIVRMSYDDGLQAVPQALKMNSAQFWSFGWGFALLSNLVLSFVGLQLMLALVVSALTSASAKVTKREQDDIAVAKLRKTHLIKRDRGTIGKLVVGITDSALSPILDGLDITGDRLNFQEGLKRTNWSGKCCPRLRNMCKSMLKSQLWRPGIVLLIALYTLCLMAKIDTGYEPSDTVNKMMELALYCEFVLVIAFCIEILINNLGAGWRLCLSNQEYQLDCIILFCTLVGFLFKYMQDDIKTLGNDENLFFQVTISDDTFRKFRLLRIAQLLRMLYKNTAIFKIMSDIFKTWKALVGVVLLVLFSTCMTSIIGMHLIGGTLGEGTPEEFYPRTNFETFSSGLWASFEFMVGTGWSGTLSWYTHSFRETNPSYVWLPQTFLCILFLWTNAILFNLFVAVLLINFGMDEHLKMPEQKKNYQKWAKRHVDESMALMEAIRDDTMKGEESMQHSEGKDLVALLTADLNRSRDHCSFYIFHPTNPVRIFLAQTIVSGKLFWVVWVVVIVMACLSVSFQNADLTYEMDMYRSFGCTNCTAINNHEPSQCARQQFCRGQIYYYAFSSLEVVVVLLFAMEAVAKSIACGFTSRSGPTIAYLRDNNNIGDFMFLVAYVSSHVSWVTRELHLDATSITLIRNLGPMIGLLQVDSIRIVLNGFAAALPGVLVLCVPVLFLLLVFSIVGVEFYGGRTQRCCCSLDARIPVLSSSDESIFACAPDYNETYLHTLLFTPDYDAAVAHTASSPIAINQIQCNKLGHSFAWQNDPNVGGFDNVFDGIQFLYVALTSGYIPSMHMLQDTSAAGFAPIAKNNHSSATAYFVLMHTVFTLFLMNIFIGVISITFSKQSGKSLVTSGQKRWNRCSANVNAFNPELDKQLAYRPQENAFMYGFRMTAFNIVLDRRFNIVSALAIVLNTILLATEHYPLRIQNYDVVLEVANTILLAWFMLEMVLRLIGFGLRDFCKDKGLLFDAFIVIGSVANRVISSHASGMELFRIFRSLRLLLVARGAGQSMQQLLAAVGECLYKSTDILLINLLVIYLFAIVGMKKFGDDNLTSQLCSDEEKAVLDVLPSKDDDCYTNFHNFINSFCALVQISIGQEYHPFLGAIRVHAPEKQVFAFAYFSSYFFLSVFMSINLFVVSVLDNFDSLTEVDQAIDFKHFWGFTFAWADLTIGAHACPSLGLTAAKDFVISLKEVVDDEVEGASKEAFKISGFTDHDVDAISVQNSLRETFAGYGKLATGSRGVDVRKLHGVICHAVIIFEKLILEKKQKLLADELKLGNTVLKCEESRAGKFAAGVATISLPGELRDELGSVNITINSAKLQLETTGDTSPSSPTTPKATYDHPHIYFRVTSRAKHLRHGGHHVTYVTRPGIVQELGSEVHAINNSEAADSGDLPENNFAAINEPIEFTFEESFDFHINEHSRDFVITMHDAQDYECSAISEIGVPLEQIKACTTETELELEVTDNTDRSIGKLVASVFCSPVEKVPDWHYMTDFATDNEQSKPKGCGHEGWLWMKGPRDHSFAMRWVFLKMEPEPCLCYINDIDSEAALAKAATSTGRKGLANKIVAVPANQINMIKNISVAEHSGPSKIHRFFSVHQNARDARKAAIMDCEFEFSTNRSTIDKDHFASEKSTGFFHHHKTWDMNQRIGTLWMCVVSAKELPVMDSDGATDAYCRISVDGQTLHTQTVHDTVTPVWNEAFYFPVRRSEEEFAVVQLFDDDFVNDSIVGEVRISLDELISDCVGSHPGSKAWDEWYKVQAVRKSPKLDTGQTLGEVRIRLKFVDHETEEEVLNKWIREDIKAERIRPKAETYRCRTLTNERKYGWLYALNWLANGCPAGLAGLSRAPSWPALRGARMPPARLVPHDHRRAVICPAEMDLPFSRLRHLFYNLRRFNCLQVKESRSYLLYATFQIEMYAWKLDYSRRADLVSKRDPHELGSRLEQFAGLDFHATMERLCLLFYGKPTSLSFHAQMDEYTHERRHVALHIIQTCLQAWALRRRAKKSSDSMGAKIHPAWLKSNGEVKFVYLVAVDGVRNVRMSVLRFLRSLVEKNNPLVHFGTLKPKKEDTSLKTNNSKSTRSHAEMDVWDMTEMDMVENPIAEGNMSPEVTENSSPTVDRNAAETFESEERSVQGQRK